MRIGNIVQIGERELPLWQPTKKPEPIAVPLRREPAKELERVPEKAT